MYHQVGNFEQFRAISKLEHASFDFKQRMIDAWNLTTDENYWNAYRVARRLREFS